MPCTFNNICCYVRINFWKKISRENLKNFDRCVLSFAWKNKTNAMSSEARTGIAAWWLCNQKDWCSHLQVKIVLNMSLFKQPHTRQELEICAKIRCSKYVAHFGNIQAEGLKRPSSLAPLRLSKKFLVKILQHAEKCSPTFWYTLLCYYFTLRTYDTKAIIIITIIIIFSQSSFLFYCLLITIDLSRC
jgi:hypothetical protein